MRFVIENLERVVVQKFRNGLGLLLCVGFVFVLPVRVSAVSFNGGNSAENEWSYNLTISNTEVLERGATITLRDLFGVTNISGPTDSNINGGHENWTSRLVGGTAIWEYNGPLLAAGGNNDTRNIFGFKVVAADAAVGPITVETNGFRRLIPPGGRDISTTVQGPFSPVVTPPSGGGDEPDGPCTAQTFLGATQFSIQPLSTLYKLRNRLNRTETGKEYVRQYYRHTPEVTRMLLKSPQLRSQFTRAILGNLRKLELIASGKPTLMSDVELAVMKNFANSLAAHASPSLKRDLSRFNGKLRSDAFLAEFGLVKSSRDSTRQQRIASNSKKLKGQSIKLTRRRLYQSGVDAGLAWANEEVDSQTVQRLESLRKKFSRNAWIGWFSGNTESSPAERLFARMYPSRKRSESLDFWAAQSQDGRIDQHPLWLRGFVDGALRSWRDQRHSELGR